MSFAPWNEAGRDFAPKLVQLTDDVLFGDVWEREELSKRDRSPGDRGRAHRRRQRRAAPVPLEPGQGKRRDGGGTHRDHHALGVLQRLAQGDVRYHSRQGDLQEAAMSSIRPGEGS
jgi:hypothetical protein